MYAHSTIPPVQNNLPVCEISTEVAGPPLHRDNASTTGHESCQSFIVCDCATISLDELMHSMYMHPLPIQCFKWCQQMGTMVPEDVFVPLPLHAGRMLALQPAEQH